MLRRISVIGLLLAFGLIVAACGDSESTETTETTVPPLDTTTTAAPTTTEAPAETTTAAPEETTTTEAMDEFDLVAAVYEYESTIPEGWMNVGDTAAFKDAVEASNALVIDVRQPEEYAEGHIPGSVNIPLRELGANIDKIPTDRQVFVYCKSGYRAGVAVSSLRMMGYDNALSYSGSWLAWTEAGEEVSTEATEAEVVGAPDFHPDLVAAVDGWLSTIPEGWLTAGGVEDVKTAHEAGAFLLDIRTPGEYAEGYILDATNIELRTITENMDMIPTDTAVVVYCKSGFRASLSMPVLGVLGFDNAKAFTGSYKAWVEAGEEVTTG
jgi:rhodanese-related sulfurtransferase